MKDPQPEDPGAANAPKGIQPEADLLGELKRTEAFLKTSRKQHKRQLDEAFQHHRINPAEYQDGLKALNNVQPSWPRRVVRKLPDIVADHFVFAIVALTLGVSVEFELERALGAGATFVELFYFCFPLTVATIVIVWMVDAQVQSGDFDPLQVFVWGSFILVFAAGIQRALPGHTPTFKGMCFSDYDPHCNPGNWVAAFFAGYWRARGPGVLFTCVVTGVLVGLATDNPAATRRICSFLWRRWRDAR